MTRIELFIKNSKPVQSLIAWLRRIYLPGFEGVSLFDSMNFFRKQIFSDRFNSRAAAVSFSFLMALPPLLLFFFSLIPFLPLPEDRIISVIHDMLVLITPNAKVQQSINNIISNFIHHKKNVLLSFSVLLTLFYSSNGVMGLMISFDRNIPGFKRRGAFKQRMIAVGLTFLLIFAILFAVSFMIFESWAADALNLSFLSNSVVLKIIAYLLIISITFFAIACIYKYGCATVSKLNWINPGTVTATFLIVVLTFIFFYAVNNLVNYDKVYGSIGTLIIFMVWINLMAQIMLIGFELNASIIANKKESIFHGS
ncbi:MAG: YihY/virulence factor BrkB family protein [Bacteroidetes bacterium]|nr:YihY/virulence factor BrkB family protein [Bacteroidota bacterium]MBK8145540.1 YihY/virulence factor BrkB family protein [Bacteroidota bacterium]